MGKGGLKTPFGRLTQAKLECRVPGLFFRAVTTFGLGANHVDTLKDAGKFLMVILIVLGWVMLGIGAIWSALDVFRESHKELLTHRA